MQRIKRIAPWAALGALAAVVAASFALGWSLTGQATAQNSQQLLYWYCFAQTEDGVTYFSRTGRADTRAAAESTFRLVATTEATSQGKKLATLSCGSEWPDRADELYASADDFTALTDEVAALSARVAALESAAPTPAPAPAAGGGAPGPGEGDGDGGAPSPGEGGGGDEGAPSPGEGDGDGGAPTPGSGRVAIVTEPEGGGGNPQPGDDDDSGDSPTPEATPTASPTPEATPTASPTPEATPTTVRRVDFECEFYGSGFNGGPGRTTWTVYILAADAQQAMEILRGRYPVGQEIERTYVTRSYGECVE